MQDDQPYAIEVDVAEPFSTFVRAEELVAAAAATLRHLQVANAALTIVVTDDETVRHLNLDCRGVDAPTDVLSFAAQESLPDGPALILPPELAEEMASYLGDLLLAYPYTERQAARYGRSVAAESAAAGGPRCAAPAGLRPCDAGTGRQHVGTARTGPGAFRRHAAGAAALRGLRGGAGCA